MLCSSFTIAHCQVMDEKFTCEGSMFWEKGFIAFQAAINAAIIEVSIELKKSNCIVYCTLMHDAIMNCPTLAFT